MHSFAIRAICFGVLLLLLTPFQAPAQKADWEVTKRMSYEQALETYQDCGLRRLDKNLFSEQYPGLVLDEAPAAQESATISVNYSGGFPPGAREAFQRAVDIWESHITSPVTIRMDARWEELGGSTLGAAGPFFGLVDTNDDGQGDTILGSPLIDALTGTDQEPGDPDIIARFNSSRDDWHFGEGPAPAGTIDFTSVVLHEITHGLNYIDYFNYNDGSGGYGFDFNDDGQIEGEERSPGAFGRRLVVEEQFSDALSSLTNESRFPNPSQDLGDALTSDRLFFDGENANRGAELGNGPVPPKVYAPQRFQGGSSIAHLSESAYPPETSNALMTPRIGMAETNRTPGPVVCGQMRDMGWALGTGCQRFFRDVFALNVQESSTSDGTLDLSWRVGENTDIERYLVDARYFDGEFQTIRRIDASPSGEPTTVSLDSLGLGAFTFRLRWTRSDGTVGTSAEQVRDTINVGNVRTATTAETDGQGRGTVTLSWSEPPGTAPGVTYRVQRQTGTNGPFQTVATTSQTSYTADQQTPGRYRYRVRSEDRQGNAVVSETRGVQVEFEGDVYALGPYPNPTRQRATFELTAREAQPVTVRVFNSLGQRMYAQEREVRAQEPVTLTIDVGDWSSGSYFLRVSGDQGISETKKIVVVR